MAKLTEHAKERLKERFKIDITDNAELCTIGDKLNNKKFHRIISNSEGMEIREIVHGGNIIQGVIRKNNIVTVTNASMVQDSEALNLEKLRINYDKLYNDLNEKEMKIQTLMEQVRKLTDDRFYISFIQFLYMRIKEKRRSK